MVSIRPAAYRRGELVETSTDARSGARDSKFCAIAYKRTREEVISPGTVLLTATTARTKLEC